MGNSKDVIEIDGKVTETLASEMFRVELESGQIVIAYLAGRLRQNKIRITIGDRVKLALSPYDLTKGRITFRY
jgi:translation initiation factor IF-1